MMQAAEDWNYPGLAKYATVMHEWVEHEQCIAYQSALTAPLPNDTWRLFLGVLVYGEYVDRFLRLCVPSLLAPGNVPALSDPLIVIHTDRASVDQIVAGVEAKLTSFARVEVHIIPEHILDAVPENVWNKYWLLGAAHNLHMQQAKYRACAYHMLMPDHVYGVGYFTNLMRLKDQGARVIVQGALSAKMEAVAPLLEAANGVIEPDRLTGLAVQHMHPQLDAFLLNSRADLPGSLLLVLVGQKTVHIASPHISIAYLSHDVLMRAPLRLFNTVDAQLPWFVPDDVDPVIPGPDDGMVYIEVSDTDKVAHWRGDGCTIEEFCARFWIMLHCVRGFERFFALTTILRLPADYMPPLPPMTDAEIERIKRHVRTAVTDSYDAIFTILPERLRIDPIDWVAQRQRAA